MTGETIIFTEEEREQICTEPLCEEHADGPADCPIPRTKAEAKEQMADVQTSESLIGDAEPKTATGIVERSDE